MILRLMTFFLLLAPALSFAQVTRFNENQIAFELQNNDGDITKCSHELLSHVPWWKVICGKRSYTVDAWVQVMHHKTDDLTKVTLMYDVSEGVASSGEKLVQFNTHYTTLYVQSLTHLKYLTSDMDVRNGLQNLVLTAKMP